MHAGLRITAFAAALAATFGAAYGAGGAVAPVIEDGPPARQGGHTDMPSMSGKGGSRESEAPGGPRAPKDGRRPDPGTPAADPGTPAAGAGERSVSRLAVRDGGGRVGAADRPERGKGPHPVVASRDRAVHRRPQPAWAAGGARSGPADPPRAGGHRVPADFTPAGEGAAWHLTPGADPAVSGAHQPRRLPAPDAIASTGGHEVRPAGALRSGRSGEPG